MILTTQKIYNDSSETNNFITNETNNKMKMEVVLNKTPVSKHAPKIIPKVIEKCLAMFLLKLDFDNQGKIERPMIFINKSNVFTDLIFYNNKKVHTLWIRKILYNWISKDIIKKEDKEEKKDRSGAFYLNNAEQLKQLYGLDYLTINQYRKYLEANIDPESEYAKKNKVYANPDYKPVNYTPYTNRGSTITGVTRHNQTLHNNYERFDRRVLEQRKKDALGFGMMVPNHIV